MRTPGVYVFIADRTRRSKGESVSVDGFTPKQAQTIIARALRQAARKQRKAG